MGLKFPHQTIKTQCKVRDFYLLYWQSHATARSPIRLNDLVNLNSNSVSWGSTPHSGRIGGVISTQLWLLHWNSRVLQSEPNHSPHYGLQGQISVGGPQNQPLYLSTEINWNSFVAPWRSPSTPYSFTFVQTALGSLSTVHFMFESMQKHRLHSVVRTSAFRSDHSRHNSRKCSDEVSDSWSDMMLKCISSCMNTGRHWGFGKQEVHATNTTATHVTPYPFHIPNDFLQVLCQMQS